MLTGPAPTPENAKQQRDTSHVHRTFYNLLRRLLHHSPILSGSVSCIKILETNGTESGRSASASLPAQMSERIKSSSLRDIGQSPHAALASGNVQKDHAVACLSVTLSTNGRSVYVCYSAALASLQRIRRTYFRHHQCVVATMRSIETRSLKRQQHIFDQLRDAPRV